MSSDTNPSHGYSEGSELPETYSKSSFRHKPLSDLEFIEDSLLQSRDTVAEFIQERANLNKIWYAANAMVDALQKGGKIIACGNGGSMSDAIHFASELTGKFLNKRRALPAIAISDPGHLSCVANDYGYEEVFSRYIEAHGKTGDVLLAISTSGNSVNVNNAIEMGFSIGMRIIGMSGILTDPAKTRMNTSHTLIQVNSADTRLIQEVHIKVIHVLVMMIEKGMGL